ncbi:MAG: hypothetical protein AAGE52_00130 [Myxococcota bacterium]
MKTAFASWLVVLTAFSSVVSAQDSAVIRRLVQNAQMPENAARTLLRSINGVLREDAQRGGDRFDSDLRREVHAALYGNGPPPRAEYYDRVRTVLEALGSGLDEATLTGLFKAGRNASVMCAHRYGVTMGECDALLAAATNTPSALPYLAPDDGRELEGTLRRARVNRRVAREVTRKLRTTMLGVPRNLTRDNRGRGLLRLLEACPGGVSDRESQVRGWHVGPTPGLAQCIAAATGRLGGPQAASQLFEMSPRAAEAFVQWGGGSAAPPPPPVVNNPPPPRNPRTNPRSPRVNQMSAAEALRQQARAQFRLQNYSAAASAYQSAAQMEPGHGGTWAGLGAAKLAMRDFAGAIAAYQQAVAADESNAAYFVALGRAFAQNNQRDAAVAALQQAMRLDQANQAARDGLRALGGEPPPPPLPETPPRDAILSTMAPLRGAIQGCSPSFNGRVTFSIKVSGNTGEVIEVSSEGADENDAACMESVVQSARFPRFTRDELSIAYPFQLGT